MVLQLTTTPHEHARITPWQRSANHDTDATSPICVPFLWARQAHSMRALHICVVAHAVNFALTYWRRSTSKNRTPFEDSEIMLRIA